MTRKVIRPCLYCDELGSSKEHVLPEMFGRFANTLTTHDVCRDCNNVHFGHRLEGAFGRNSAEAVLRLIFGAKAAEEAGDIGGNRVTVTYLEKGDLYGARLAFVSSGPGPYKMYLPPQVIIEHRSVDVPCSLLEDEITPEAIAPFRSGSKFVIPNAGDAPRLIAAMKRVGFVFGRTPELFGPEPASHPESHVRITGLIDDEIARVVTKIAVNFVAVIAGYDFAMRPELRPMRKYARYGDPCLRGNVTSVYQSIADDSVRDRYGDGHMLTLDWPVVEGVSLLFQVCFFNRITHQVVLASDINAVWRNLRAAYHFDTATRRAIRVKLSPGEHLSLLKPVA